ncbi:MAG: hypothetical protein ACM31D_03075 [Bacteroidota bacterium]
MVRITPHFALALLTAAALASPAAAEEQGSDWLGAVGEFVSAGLGPARTLDDIRREEERAREAREAATAIPEAAPAPKVALPAPPPAAETDAAPPVVAAPVPVAPVAPRSAMPAPPRPAAKPVVAAAPASAPVPVPTPRPKPVVPVAAAAPAPVAAPAPAPEVPGSRIAATATMDQAIKLGGSADNYGLSAAKPVGN